MNRIEILIDKIINNDIKYIEYDTKLITAAAIKINKNKAIIVNKNKFKDSKDFYVTLSHEFLHCNHDVFYNMEDSIQTRKRREYKIDKLMVQELVPLNEFKKLLKYGLNKYEISEEMDVTEESVDLAFKIYKNMGEL